MTMKKFLVSHLRIFSFGKFSNTTIHGFQHPFVVVHGENESGKSTITEFITWMIGGPVGNTADAHRFADAGNVLSGELTGRLDDDAVEIEGKFSVTGNQKWGPRSADRKGYVAGLPVDLDSIEAVFGGIAPADYAFIYRFIGPILHDTESAGSFEGLMTQFALGSAASDVDPRAVEKALRKIADDHKKTMTSADKAIGAIKGELTALLNRPRRLAEIDARLSKISDEISDLDLRIGALSREEGVARQAIEAFDKSEALRLAQLKHDALAIPDSQWDQAVKNSTDIRRLLGEIHDARNHLKVLQEEADDLSSKIGIRIEELAGRVFSIDAKNRVRNAGSVLGGAQSNLVSAQKSVGDAEENVTTQQLLVHESAQKIGLTTYELDVIPSLMGTWNELNNAAIMWAGAEVDAREKSAKTEKDASTAAGLRQKLKIEEELHPSTVPLRRTNLVYPVALIGIIGAIGSLFSPVIGVAAGVILVGLLAWSFMKSGNGSTVVGEDVLRSLKDDLVHAERRAADSKTESEKAWSDVETKRTTFVSRLSTFGVTPPPSDIAQNLCLRIKAASEAIDAAKEAQRLHGQQLENLARCELEVSQAEQAFSDICAELNLPYSGALDQLDNWLDVFDAAISASRKFTDFSRDLASKETSLSQLLGAAEPAVSGFPHHRLLEELEQHERIADDFRSSAKALSDAQIAADAAIGGKEEVSALLEEGTTKEELSSQLDTYKSSITELGVSRDKLIEERRSLSDERDEIEDDEYINAISLRRSEQEELKEEASLHRDAADLAASTLGAVIDQFERDNQGPLVTRANELLAAVVPNYGSLVYKRDDSGKPVIERVDDSHRLRTTKLSTGSRALAYLALRLAFVEADHAKRGVALPVLCDDPLVHVDDKRAPEVIKVLAQASASRQVILFTCHEDTRDLAVAAGAHVVSLA